MEYFPQEWTLIVFKIKKIPNQAMTVDKIIPFKFPQLVQNPTAKFDINNKILFVSYNIPLDFHTTLCQEGYIVYGVKKNDMLHITLIVQESWYCDALEILSALTSIFDIPNEIIKLICMLLNFSDQLNLRTICKDMRSKLHYSDFKIYTSWILWKAN